jgi:glycerol uptake facilitator-like aquaporin
MGAKEGFIVFSKEKLSMVAAEFTGTLMLTMAVLVSASLFGLGTAAWYVSLTAGATLALIIAKLGHVSGAHVNPAVTIGLWTLKRISTTNAFVYIAVQILGGAVALLAYNYFTNETLPTAGSGNFDWRTFWAEVAGAVVFGSGIAAAVSQKIEGFYASFTIGGSLSAGAILASTASAGFLNPAVALGNNAWDRTTAIAPVVGIVAGMNIYMWLFAPAEKKSRR